VTVELGRYRVGDVVGSGRTGRILRGERTDDGADVAVRQIPPRLLESREIRGLVKNLPFRCFGLRSPAIVPVLDAFEISGSVAVVEPWIEGPPLGRGNGPEGAPLTRADVALHLVALLEGLRELHDRGTVHGDVRADNILVSRAGPRLVGLGVADVLGRRMNAAKGAGSTHTGEIGDAPELSDHPATAATDLYGLAAAYRGVLRMRGTLVTDPLLLALDRGASLDLAARWPSAEEFLAEVRSVAEAVRGVDAVAEHGGTTRAQRAARARSSLDEPGIDIGSGLSFDDGAVEGADLSLDASSEPADSPPAQPEKPPTPGSPPRSGAVGLRPDDSGLGMADGELEVDDAPAMAEDEEALPDDVTTKGRYGAVSDPSGGGIADYRWLIVSGGFALAIVGLYFGFILVRSLLPDLPDDMVEIEAGTMRVGSETGPPPERPGFEFSHARFFVDRAEVTVAQYQTCVATGECTPTTGRVQGSPPSGDLPVVGVTWLQAQSYCTNAGKRLPTENEWEAAARRFGGTYGTGDDPPSCDDATFARADGSACSRGAGSRPVRAAEASDEDPRPVDMSGNVWEFVDSDWSAGRPPGSGDASPAGGSVLKIIKGGGWFSPIGQLRTAARLPVQNIYWAADVGFRCAQEPDR
jgi:formylglycine-generating enzyme required for sulfatase activity